MKYKVYKLSKYGKSSTAGTYSKYGTAKRKVASLKRVGKYSYIAKKKY
jgi:hypothetical protein